MSTEPTNPLFEGFKPQAIGEGNVVVKENPFTGETSVKPETAKQKKAREKQEAAAAAKQAKADKAAKAAKAAEAKKKRTSVKRIPITDHAPKPKEPPALRDILRAASTLKDSDILLFEAMLSTDAAARKRVMAAVEALFA